MKPFLLLFIIPVFLISCSKTEPLPVEKEEKVPLIIKNYLKAQSEGDWFSLCKLLAPQSAKEIIVSLKAKDCQDAFSKNSVISERLRLIAKSTELESVKESAGLISAEFKNPQGFLWVKNNKVYLSRPD